MSARGRDKDATALTEAFAAGDSDPIEAAQDALDRLARLNPSLNAVLHQRPEAAMAEAGEAAARWSDRRARRTHDGPVADTPFDGVPIAVKDLGCEQAGEFHHAGARFLVELEWRGTQDSHLYRLLRGAGMVSIGRTNTPEFGTTITTEPAVYGATSNPWDVSRSPGGSSGGSAAAVAAGIVPVAHGNDGGGSIRVPAAACGLVGLKPSRGRVSTAPRLGEHRGGFAVDGMLTRSVRDAARCLDVIGRPAPGDPYVAPPLAPGVSFADSIEAARSLRPLRIAVSVGAAIGTAGARATEPVRHAVEQAAALLTELGHHVETDTCPHGWYSDELTDHAIVVRTVGMAAEMDGWAERLGRPMTPEDIEPANWWSAELGRSLPAAAYVSALEGLSRWRRGVMSFWRQPGAHADPASSGFDLLLTPVLGDVTPPLGYLSDPAEGARRLRSLIGFVDQANVSGQPAISLPTAHDPDGLPLGTQLIAAHGAESLLLAVAEQISEADGLIDLPEQLPDPTATGPTDTGPTDPGPTDPGPTETTS